jgi:RNA polymerase sigma-70 factor (sigma-E family)
VTENSFSDYVAARQRSLVRLAFLLAGDFHAAEDIVQSALARTYLSWNRIRDKQALDAYVRRAVVNEHINWWRRAWRRMEHSTGELPNWLPVEPTPELSDEHDSLRGKIQALPRRQRAVIVLRYYEGLSIAETADVLGCAEGTVRSNASRALKALRTGLSGSSTASFAGPQIMEGRK